MNENWNFFLIFFCIFVFSASWKLTSMFCMWGFITSTLPCSSITVTAIWRMKYSSLKNRKSYKNTEDLLFTFAEKILPQKLKIIQEYMEGGQRALLIHCMVSQHCWIIHKYAAVLIRPWHVPYLLLCSFGQFTKQFKPFYVLQFLSAKLPCCIRRATAAMWKFLSAKLRVLCGNCLNDERRLDNWRCLVHQVWTNPVSFAGGRVLYKNVFFLPHNYT